jgi:hypothetical protein
VNIGSDYKTLIELEVPRNASDSNLFKQVKDAYNKLRGLRALYAFLMKPVDVHFVQVNILLHFLNSLHTV